MKKKSLRDVTPRLVEYLPDNAYLHEDLTLLSDNSEIYIMSRSAIILYLTMKVADILLVTDKRTNPFTIDNVHTDEVIIMNT